MVQYNCRMDAVVKHQMPAGYKISSAILAEHHKSIFG